MIHPFRPQFLFYLMLLPITVFADTWNSAQRTQTHVIQSGILDEERTVLVRMPPGYDPQHRYPVVYVPDAEWNFELVASYLDYMADNDIYPDMIVTGAVNVNRNRDYIPRPDPHYRDTGQADRYLAFVKNEWLPFISENYASAPQRVLIGHSFGGVITLHTLFSEPDLFNAYIALGSSAWIADRVLFEEAEVYFEKNPEHDAFVYMAVGEGDGGPTVPSSRDLAALFQLHAPASLEWKFDVTPRTDHFKNVPSGMHDAFMALFPAWEFDRELAAVARDGGVEGVRNFFAAKTETLGWRFLAAWFDLGIVALNLVREDLDEEALAVMEAIRKHHPQNAIAAEFSGMVLERTENFQEATSEYKRAMQLAREQGLHPNAVHLDRLQASLERVQSTPGQ
jgi:predicted alpha/beta superfamily hydrolase